MGRSLPVFFCGLREVVSLNQASSTMVSRFPRRFAPVMVAVFFACSVPVASAVRLPIRLQPLGRAGKPSNLPSPQRDANSTAALYNALKKDLIFFERFAFLLFRTTSRCLQALQTWLALDGLPPRVMVVQLTGVIAAEDDGLQASSQLPGW